MGADVRRHCLFEAVGHFLPEGQPLGVAGRVDTLRQHLLPAGGAGAVLVLDDVEEEAVHGRQQREHFIDVRLEEVDVRSVQAELGIEAGLVGPLPLNRAVGCNLQPLRLLLRGVVVPLHGGVDRQADVAGVGGFDLLGQQVALQVRVAALRVRLGVVEDHAVMAAGEAGDRVHMGVDQLLCPGRGVELAAYVGELFAGVEVEVDLAVAEEVRHWDWRSCGWNSF